MHPPEHEHDVLLEDEEHGDAEHRGDHEGDEPADTADDDAEHPDDGEREDPADGELEDPADDDPPPLTEVPAPPASEKQIEQAVKKLEKEATRHAERVAEVMGEDFADLVPCPLCTPIAPGFRFQVPPPPEVVAAVKAAIGEPAQPAFKEDSYSKTCDLCDGLGAVETGSRVNGQTTARCLGCDGRGWVAVGPERQSGTLVSLPVSLAPPQYDPVPPAPVEPPEVAALKALGYVVVAPIPPLPAAS